MLGMPYPGGAEFDRASFGGNPFAVKLPSPALAGEELDFSFSGLKTAALNLINSAAQKGEEISRADLAASYTATIVRAIEKKVDQALAQTGERTLVMAGGVAANSHLRRALGALCERRGVKLIAPPPSLCGDNGAMIGSQAYYEYLAGTRADMSLNAYATKSILGESL